MSYLAGVVLACVAMAIMVGIAHQVWLYTRGRGLLTRRQFGLRLATGLLLLVTIGLIFFGTLYRFADLRLALLYWMLPMVLALVVIILAWLDLRALQRVQHRHQAELYQNLAQLQQELRDRKPGQD